ncbi:hypothetical protein F7725_004939 [Dissostichus mawsoni]|uniref:Uncharacterized protein n=1 Tax=Dissostichus mawsoni TaxID=36200 RepID=A0A7J5XK59_DISMA|nr:hypothetical protein F7725_004939 [Dissostichus mawsoni]
MANRGKEQQEGGRGGEVFLLKGNAASCSGDCRGSDTRDEGQEAVQEGGVRDGAQEQIQHYRFQSAGSGRELEPVKPNKQTPGGQQHHQRTEDRFVMKQRLPRLREKHLILYKVREVMSAPNLLRVGTAENVFVECQDCTGEDKRVEIHVMSHPTKNIRLATASVTLNSADNFQALVQIMIPAGDFSKDPSIKQYVYLQAQFPDRLLEKVVMVSFQSGYIFIQTDKTIYTPTAETPEGIILARDPVSLKSGIHSGDYQLAEIVSPGLWKVVTKFHSNPQQSFSAEFEVKEYVLPSFEVKLNPTSSFFYVDDEELKVNIKATYLFGQEVNGMAYVVFGVINDGEKKSFPSSLQRVQIEEGVGAVTLKKEHITTTFQNIEELVTKSIYVAVSVLTENGGEMVEAELRNIQIVKSPYTIHFKKTPKYFKPGMSFDVAIMSRGQLVQKGRHKTSGQVLISLTVLITKDMLPSFRIIAYYHTNENEVVSDSVWVDVKDSCMGSVWDIVEKYDTGCTPGGGKDGMSVFFDAGLLFESNAASGTAYRQVSNYTEKLQRDCCLDGMRDTLLSYTCERRVEYIFDGEACAAAFLHCCKDMENQRAESKVESLQLARRICVGDSLEVIVRKEFFIDLRLPYSAVRGEQLEVKAILHNYSPDPATVRVDLIEEDNVCSSASKRGKYRQEVRIGAQTTRSVPFIIIPMKEGEFRIEVKAAVKDSSLNDGIMKMLRVVPEGVLVKDPKIVIIDPTNQGVGREQVSALVEKAVSGNSMGSLIKQPYGCGEQNMYHMTLPLIAATYLDKTNQWETVGFQKRNEALQHIKTGYNTELTYRKTDGSFAAYPKRPSSSWLTAYVAKVFAMANNLVAVHRPYICEAIKFLILNAQQPDGLFRELHAVIMGHMMGGVSGSDSDASMTAFCLIAMQESRTLCAASVGLNHWPTSQGRVVTREATAYALLALVKAEAFEDARPVVRWFNKQQKVGGGYGSTQATIMVYQAISEYWSSAKEPEYDLNVDILLPGRAKPEKYNFNRDNHYATRTSKMVSLYYALPKQKESDCQKFNLSVQLIPEKMDEEEKIYKLRIEVLYKDKERDAAMSILDIGLLTGFTVNTKDLDLLSKGHARTIAKYEMDKVLSERGSLILYLDKVSHTRPEEIIFRVHQKMKVGVLQPAAVSVYEYYEQTHCVQFYHPERKGGQLLRLCRVYKMKLDVFEDGLSTDIYTMRVLEVIKEGTFDVGPLNKLRTFLSYPHCRESLDLVVGKTYLIMGTSDDIHRDDAHQAYQYVLGERTWIEYWPTEAECQADEHRPTCLGMEEMVQQYQLFGFGDVRRPEHSKVQQPKKRQKALNHLG